MAVSYNRLWKMLIDKNLSKAELRKAADISPNTMTKLNKDEMVALSVLDRICCVLNTDYGDIMQYVPAKENDEKQETIA